jgi:aminoglycoside phosphotransferase (APT) family kinase protein
LADGARISGDAVARRTLVAVDVTSGIDQAVAELEPGGQLVGMRALTGGVSANVFRVDIVTSAGRRRRVVFRQHGSADFKHHGQTVTVKEYGVLAALHQKGFAVPEPYLYNDTNAVTAPYLILEWIDGSTELAADDLPGALDQMARFLVSLHALDPRSLQLPELEPIEDPLAAVIPYLPSTEAGLHAKAVLASGALDRGGPNHLALLHGDYWPGNVIWQGGRLVAVIDWEDARLGDPLADLATARVELLCRYGDDAMERFTTSYLAVHHDTIGPLRLDSLSLWELYVSASALAIMGDWGLEPAEEARRRRRTERFFNRAARQLG